MSKKKNIKKINEFLKEHRGGVPEGVEHVVGAIYAKLRKKGITRQQAWAIAVGRLQDLGYLKKGTLQLTKKGKKWNLKKLKEDKEKRAKRISMATGKRIK